MENKAWEQMANWHISGGDEEDIKTLDDALVHIMRDGSFWETHPDAYANDNDKWGNTGSGVPPGGQWGRKRTGRTHQTASDAKAAFDDFQRSFNK